MGYFFQIFCGLLREAELYSKKANAPTSCRLTKTSSKTAQNRCAIMEKRVLSYYDSDTAVSRRNRNCDTTVGPNDKNPQKITIDIVKLSDHTCASNVLTNFK